MTHRILITGGAGFVGSHLAEALLAQGHAVTVVDDLSTGRMENIAPLAGQPGFRFVIDTIENEVVMDRLAGECDTIVHLAAAVGVELVVHDPVRTIETNILGTRAVLQAAKRYGCKVLLASTSEVYGRGVRVPFSEEDDRVEGPTTKSRWCYAASKAVDEFLGLAYHRQYGLPVVIFRLFNTVGPRQSGRYGMVVPRFVRWAMEGEPLAVYGDGSQTRCFLHVADAVRAIAALAACPEAVGQVYNVGSTEEVSILELARRVLDRVDRWRAEQGLGGAPGQPASGARIRLIPYEEAYEAGFEDMQRRVPDTSKIRRATGWVPEKGLEEILGDVVGSMK